MKYQLETETGIAFCYFMR